MDFQINALEKGWTIEDMPLLEALADIYYSPEVEPKDIALSIMNSIRNAI